jgi:hypothetical protein
MTTLQVKKLLHPAAVARREYNARLFVAGCDGEDTTHPVEAIQYVQTLAAKSESGS